jgi:hypothetical protein
MARQAAAIIDAMHAEDVKCLICICGSDVVRRSRSCMQFAPIDGPALRILLAF